MRLLRLVRLLQTLRLLRRLRLLRLCDCCRCRDSGDYGMNTMPVSHRDGPLAHGRAQYEYAARLKSSASVTEGEFRPACTASGDRLYEQRRDL